MSTLKEVILNDNNQDVDTNLDWSYIEWLENEVVTTGVANAQTQTEPGPFVDKQTQTSSPVIMHIDLARTHSKLRHASLVDADSLVAPLFQFDRQAPGRISTSPTLRRMRSTRRPQMDFREPVKMASTEEEPATVDTTSPLSPLSPGHRHKSPLAATPHSDGEIHHGSRSNSSSGRQKTRSHRSKTFDNGVTRKRQESMSPRPCVSKDFEFPEVQVSFYQCC